MPKLLTLLVMTTALLAAGCGGGGSSSNNGGGGGGGGGGTATIATAGPPNVESLIIDAGPPELTQAQPPMPAINTAFISVQVCVHGSATSCQTIDHVEIDTGSVGLRILADATDTSGKTFSVPLLPVTDASGHPLAECLHFADGDSWGSVKVADIVLPVSTEHASSVNVQIIGDAAAGSPPAPCVAAPPLREENTVVTFGANGILGVGPFINDCNDAGNCPTSGTSANYYSCPTSTTCATFGASLTEQLQNPVILFAKDNNGVIIELPAVAAGGAASLGTSSTPAPVLVFGIGTENNNALGSATQLFADTNLGFISATLDGKNYPDTYFDSGSNGNFYSSSITVCHDNNAWYCPSSTVSESATLQGTGGTMATAPFNVANADTLFTDNPTFTVFPELAGPAACSTQLCSLDLGLPFFFGRNVYTGIYIPGTTPAPYFAYIAN